jgi:hypothetical protein
MINVIIEKDSHSLFDISPMSIKRDWMDVSSEKHAYHCFPVTQANSIGWSIFCKQDVCFEWDGINSERPDNVKVFGPDRAYSGRGQSSISFDTGLYFRTEENFSIITINPVNYYSDEFETMSNVISTSFYDNPLPLAIKAKAKAANKITTIKAGTPLATIIPISLTSLNNTVIQINKYTDPDGKKQAANKSYGDAAQEINKVGKWTDWYRNAVNEKGESLGSHEAKTIKLGVIDNTKDDII